MPLSGLHRDLALLWDWRTAAGGLGIGVLCCIVPYLLYTEGLRRAEAGKAAILATKGTLATGIYGRALEDEQVQFLVPEAAEQDVLMHLIYDVVKASRPLAPEEETWRALLDGLRARGADYFILGCTELPIVADSRPVAGPFVDPTAELAKAAIRFCGYEVLGE